MAFQGKWRKDVWTCKCPLHIAWREDEIMCRSAMPEAAATIHRYADSETAHKQRQIFCCSLCYERCEHYKAWKHFIWEEDE